MNKICTKCKINKSYNQFYKYHLTKDGYCPQCKECMNQYRIANAGKIKQYMKQYVIDNAEHLTQYNKQWIMNNTEHLQQYLKQWKIDNPDKVKQSDKKYRQTEHGKLVCRKKTQKRRTLKLKNTPVGKHWTPDDIVLKLKLQHNKCIYCETSIKDHYDIDHIMPLSKGGSNEPSNIQLLCQECNRGKDGKGTKMPHEFAKKFNMLF